MIDDRPSVGPAKLDARRGSLQELAVVFGLTVGVPLSLGFAAGRVESFNFGQSRLLGTVAAEVVAVAILWPWLAIHSYQGLVALTSILPLAIVFTVYYSRTKRLWPVVVSHMLFDAFGLLSVLKQ